MEAVWIFRLIVRLIKTFFMKSNFVFILLFSIALLFFSCSPKQPNISGKWQSERIENLGNGAFGKRVFNIGDNDWEVQFTLYLDSAATKPVFTFSGKGKFKLGKPSPKISQATEAVFQFDHKYITLHTSDSLLIKNFGFQPCNLVKGQKQDITNSGCSFIESKSVCGQEYDLVSIQEGVLRLGTRPAAGKNICSEENRPTSLGFPLIKAQ